MSKNAAVKSKRQSNDDDDDDDNNGNRYKSGSNGTNGGSSTSGNSHVDENSSEVVFGNGGGSGGGGGGSGSGNMDKNVKKKKKRVEIDDVSSPPPPHPPPSIPLTDDPSLALPPHRVLQFTQPLTERDTLPLYGDDNLVCHTDYGRHVCVSFAFMYALHVNDPIPLRTLAYHRDTFRLVIINNNSNGTTITTTSPTGTEDDDDTASPPPHPSSHTQCLEEHATRTYTIQVTPHHDYVLPLLLRIAPPWFSSPFRGATLEFTYNGHVSVLHLFSSSFSSSSSSFSSSLSVPIEIKNRLSPPARSSPSSHPRKTKSTLIRSQPQPQPQQQRNSTSHMSTPSSPERIEKDKTVYMCKKCGKPKKSHECTHQDKNLPQVGFLPPKKTKRNTTPSSSSSSSLSTTTPSSSLDPVS